MIRQDYRLELWEDGSSKIYYYKNKSHRLDGPAIMFLLDDYYEIYAVNGLNIAEEDFYKNYYQKND